jgi:hypothetical protein
VDDFELWVTVLLLDAMQRAGYFKAVGGSMTAAALKEKVSKGYVRFIDEALAALCRAGKPYNTLLRLTSPRQACQVIPLVL